jgi:conflict system STAND superfamily ATPase/WD40 domain-containing protein
VSASLPPSPFKGLAFFGDSEHDWRFFFGRERESELVAANLMASRLTILYGPSGVGKSSLLRAGVARRLQSLVPAADGVEDAGAEFVIVDRWRDDPVAAVAAAVQSRLDVPLADALAERTLSTGNELYLVLDQMEEYVLYHGRDGGPLADELEELLTRPDLPVHVLLGVRDDALADLDAFKRRLPALFGNLLRLDHLTRVAARSAIEGPLRAYAELGGPEVTAEDELIDAVLDQVATGRIEQSLTGRGLVDEGERARRVEAPYLQLVLERLWQVEREQGSETLRAATLDELGGAEQIVEEHLERALGRLDDEERDLAARLFDHLVTPSGSKIAHAVDDLARYARVDTERLEPVLGTLDAARLLRRVPGRSSGPPRYEIFHDVLAQAVLAWRIRHESERALAAERANSRRRHRRLASLAGIALVGLVGTLALAVWALSQRSEAHEQAEAARTAARTAKTRELEASALAQLPLDPELGLVLASQAARLAPTRATADVLRRALRESRVRTVTPLGSPLTDLAVVGPDTFAAVGARGEVRLVEGDRPGRVVVPGRSGARTWLSSGFALTVEGKTLTVRRLPDGATVSTVPVPAATRFVTAAPAARRFIIAGQRGARLIDAHGHLLAKLPHPARVERASFSGNTRRVATAGADGDAMVWDRRGRLLRVFHGPNGRLFDVGFSKLTRLLVGASSDGTARVWELTSGLLVSIMPLHGNQVRRASFGGNEDSVLTASRDRTARTWKVETGGPRAVFIGHEDTVTAAALASGDRLVTSSFDGTVRTWFAPQQPYLKLAPKLAPPRPTLDSRATVAGRLVRLRLGGRTVTLDGHTDDVLTVELSADASRVVTASRDGDARIWDARTGQSLQTLRGHGGTVFDASFSPNGRWVVTAGPATAGLWATRTGERIWFLQGHESHLFAAAFRGPTLIVTRAADGVRSFNCDTCGDLASLRKIAAERLEATGRRLSAAERREFLEG